MNKYAPFLSLNKIIPILVKTHSKLIFNADKLVQHFF
jgi:hypothetical protein